jgi:hypothetical protein
MSTRERLGTALAQPDTLADQRALNAHLSEDPGNSVPSEGNLLSLSSMLKFYPEGDPMRTVIEKTARSEMKFTVHALDGLHDPENPMYQLRSTFGTDLEAGIALGKVLKTEVDRADVLRKVTPKVQELLSEREVTRGMWYKKKPEESKKDSA